MDANQLIELNIHRALIREISRSFGGPYEINDNFTHKNTYAVAGLYPDLVLIDPDTNKVSKCIDIVQSQEINDARLEEFWRPLLEESPELIVCVLIEDHAKASTLLSSLGENAHVFCYENSDSGYKLVTCP